MGDNCRVVYLQLHPQSFPIDDDKMTSRAPRAPGPQDAPPVTRLEILRRRIRGKIALGYPPQGGWGNSNGGYQNHMFWWANWALKPLEWSEKRAQAIGVKWPGSHLALALSPCPKLGGSQPWFTEESVDCPLPYFWWPEGKPENRQVDAPHGGFLVYVV